MRTIKGLVLWLLVTNYVSAQVNVTAVAPLPHSLTSRLVPNTAKSQKYVKTCFLIRQSELAAVTGSLINQVGFSVMNGALAGMSGSITIYLENTSDNIYNKSITYTTAITTMSVHYSGPYTIPVLNATNSVMLNCATDFTYTGGGIYVAYEWEGAGPFSTTPLASAIYDASRTIVTGGLCRGVADSLPLPLGLNMPQIDIRPAMLFRLVNIVSNDAKVVAVRTPGLYPRYYNTPVEVQAIVKNTGTQLQTNIQVSMAVSGANVHNDVKTVSLNPDQESSVTFTFNAPASGISTISVSLPSDDNSGNNTGACTQSITCSQFAIPPPLPQNTYTTGWGAPTNSGVIYAMKASLPVSASLAAVSHYVLNNSNNTGKIIRSVLLDANGSILVMSNNHTITAPSLGNKISIPFTGAIPLSPNVTYYIGVEIPTSGYFPLAASNPSFTASGFYSMPNGGGIPFVTNAGNYSLEADLVFNPMLITASASSSLICTNEAVVLNASATGSVYNWSIPGAPNTASVVATPGTTGLKLYYVSGVDPMNSCPTLSATVSVSVAACTAADETVANPYRVHPNPVSDFLFLETSEAAEVKITNISGREVFRCYFEPGGHRLHTTELPAGLYLLQVFSKGDCHRMRLVKD